MDEKLESKYKVFLLSINELTRDQKGEVFQSQRKETASGNPSQSPSSALGEKTQLYHHRLSANIC